MNVYSQTDNVKCTLRSRLIKSKEIKVYSLFSYDESNKYISFLYKDSVCSIKNIDSMHNVLSNRVAINDSITAIYSMTLNNDINRICFDIFIGDKRMSNCISIKAICKIRLFDYIIVNGNIWLYFYDVKSGEVFKLQLYKDLIRITFYDVKKQLDLK